MGFWFSGETKVGDAPTHSKEGGEMPDSLLVPGPGLASPWGPCCGKGAPCCGTGRDTIDRPVRFGPAQQPFYHIPPSSHNLSWQGGLLGLAPRRAWGTAQTNQFLPQKPRLAGLWMVPAGKWPDSPSLT